MADNKNLILAFVLSMAVMLGWYHFVEGPQMEQQRRQQALQQQAQQQQQPPATAPTPQTAQPSQSVAPQAAVGMEGQIASRTQVLARSGRVPIDTPSLLGSIALTGGRIDDLLLRKYHTSVDPSSPNIELLSPAGTKDAYYAEFGWVPAAGSVRTPDASTVWTVRDGGPLRPGHPVTLTWDNGQGLRFERTYAVDENYMFTVTQRVVNEGQQTVALRPYGLVSRRGTPPGQHFYILHEGLLGVLGGTLKEIGYDDVKEDEHEKRFQSTGGWLGVTDKYWLVSLIPRQDRPFDGRFLYAPTGGEDRYQVDYLREPVTIAPGGQAEATDRLFAGAKVVNIIDRYKEQDKIVLFDRAIDWGWFYFLTKPTFKALDWLYVVFGNFGVAILAFTVLIKLLFFPLANKSYAAMNRMKRLQPEMLRLRDEYKDDRVRQQQELMALYKNEKVNPVAGCLPMLIQIPFFFALYKVLFVTIEMRHAPFYGWIRDLAAPDPTNLFTLFGLMPWDPPSFLHLGLWPIAMGISMFLQQKLNPAPQDPMQQRIFMLMPIFFTFLLASFPAGLVIYWTWNNLLSIAQQWLIMRRQDMEPARA